MFVAGSQEMGGFMMRNYIVTVLAVMLASCGPSTNMVANQSDYRLCYGLATLPSYNVHNKNRKAEIAKRGVDCGDYADRIDEQIDRERVAEASRPVQNISTYDDDRLDRLERGLAQECRSRGGTWLTVTKNCLKL
jgi:hypothetical protein